MKVSDLIMGPVIVGIGIIALVAATMQPKPFFGTGYGGGFFPSVIGYALVVAGLLLTLNGWRERAIQPLLVIGNWARSPRHIANAAVVLASLGFYIFFSTYLGFIIASFLVVFANLLQFTRAPGRSLVVAVLTILVVKVSFQDLLLVPLPWGLLEPYAGALSWR
ncbi:MAG: tripartite tricarboxylate transporter TctB family protein [Rhizobiaceae bacterium]|nr:tripartite tricarboxylate transporter TctB family protein [Rhizobiaceae bacterium]